MKYRMPFRLSKVFLSLLLCSSAAAMSQLQIVSPSSLSKPGGYNHQDAIFGHPPYGSTLEMSLYYADSLLCSPDMVSPDSGFPQQRNWDPPFYLMVDRGDCTFVTKARNAQLYGASGLLVANNLCTCLDECNSPERCVPFDPRMHEDGTGSDIRIPSLLLKKQDADDIKDELRNGTSVQVRVTFDMPSPDQRVEYELWMNPLDRSSDRHGEELIKNNWKQAAVKLGEKASFTPRLFILSSQGFLCSWNSTECSKSCTNNGRYCAYDPRGELENSSITGADVVSEILRRLCVWQVYGQGNGIGEEFWDYLMEFYERCDQSDSFEAFADQDCIALAMESAGIDTTAIDKCIVESGGLERDNPNWILKEQIVEKKEAGVTHSPYLFVNEEPVSGRISFTTTFKAICSGFSKGSEPEVCLLCASSDAIEQCLAQMPDLATVDSSTSTAAPVESTVKSQTETDDGVSAGVIAGSVIAVLFVFALVFFLLHRGYKKKLTEVEAKVTEAEVSSEVMDQTSVATPLEESESTLA